MSSSTDRPSEAAAFVTGALTVLVVLGLLLGFLALRLGMDAVRTGLVEAVRDATQSKTSRVLYLPDRIRDEIAALDGVFDNAGNPTRARPHDTILVEPDEAFGYVLRPSAEIDCYALRPKNRLNLDPPVLYLPKGAAVSAELADYIEEYAQLRYVYSIREDRRRLTLPRVASPRKIAVVGDSVAFGSGVGDGDTMASALQRRMGDAIEVLNAGVGGYSGEQALTVAEALAREGRYEGLVYLTSQNDFVGGAGWDAVSTAREILGGFGRLREAFAGRVVVLVVPWVVYALDDLLFMHERGEPLRDASQELYAALPQIAADNGLAYVDYLAVVDAYAQEQRTMFARFALYVNRGHLGPLGNEVAARLVSEALVARGLADRS